MTGDTVPRATLEAVAAGYHELMGLKAKQAATTALMIRTCVAAIERQPTPFDTSERRAKIVRERKEAIAGLLDLAKMLDQQTVRSSDTKSTEGN